LRTHKFKQLFLCCLFQTPAFTGVVGNLYFLKQQSEMSETDNLGHEQRTIPVPKVSSPLVIKTETPPWVHLVAGGYGTLDQS
jgi:hypothetical protein